MFKSINTLKLYHAEATIPMLRWTLICYVLVAFASEDATAHHPRHTYFW